MKSFNEKVYDLLKTVPSGSVTTYSQIAHALGCKAYRAVGNAMNKNPHDTNVVPCHRVVNSNGKLGGYAWVAEIKVKRLEDEGVEIEKVGNRIEEWKIKDFKNKLFEFKID